MKDTATEPQNKHRPSLLQIPDHSSVLSCKVTLRKQLHKVTYFQEQECIAAKSLHMFYLMKSHVTFQAHYIFIDDNTCLTSDTPV